MTGQTGSRRERGGSKRLRRNPVEVRTDPGVSREAAAKRQGTAQPSALRGLASHTRARVPRGKLEIGFKVSLCYGGSIMANPGATYPLVGQT